MQFCCVVPNSLIASIKGYYVEKPSMPHNCGGVSPSAHSAKVLLLEGVISHPISELELSLILKTLFSKSTSAPCFNSISTKSSLSEWQASCRGELPSQCLCQGIPPKKSYMVHNCNRSTIFQEQRQNFPAFSVVSTEKMRCGIPFLSLCKSQN